MIFNPFKKKNTDKKKEGSDPNVEYIDHYFYDMKHLDSNKESDKPIMAAMWTFQGFNGERSFLEAVALFKDRIGIGMDEHYIRFPSSLDPWEEPFEGVEVTFMDDESQIVSEDLFFDLVSQATDTYCSWYPEKEYEARTALADMAKAWGKPYTYPSKKSR